MPILESKIYIRMIINYIMGKLFACLSEISKIYKFIGLNNFVKL